MTIHVRVPLDVESKLREQAAAAGKDLECIRLIPILIRLAVLTSIFPMTGVADPPSDRHFALDQFGYRVEGQKIAVLRHPTLGFDAPDSYTPGSMIEVREASGNSVAFSAAPLAWNGGATHAQSGDRVWWFDFSALRRIGTYYLHDPTNNISSEPLLIQPDVYRLSSEPAVRMYYYQRCGTAKTAAHAGTAWSDTTCHLGIGQDLDCRSILNTGPATSRDLSGGWHDAGDYNKYVNYADDALHMLLEAYEIAPGSWDESLNLPESGNGIPDLLDEIRWELAWLLKMQNPDGSVLHKVSVSEWQSASPPSTDTAFRYYAPATASATISACGAWAHAAYVYQRLDDADADAFAGQLESAALAAWAWLNANPGWIPSNYDNQGFFSAAAEDSSYEQSMNRLRAAAHLFRLTGNTEFRSYVNANYSAARLFQWHYAMAWEEAAQNGLLTYAVTPGATASVVNQIRNAYSGQLSGASLLGRYQSATDAYRAYLLDSDYTWGSNRTKAAVGAMFAGMTRLRWDAPRALSYRHAAAGYLHYLHGVNPHGLCFLTHMDDFGAGGSIREMYHLWFGNGTVWDNADTSPYGPPPGYLTGGANPSYSPNPAYSGPPIEPPQNQPVQKSYRDWNTSWPENSWEVTECHIPYQAAYIRLLAEFSRCRGDCPADADADGDLDLADGAVFGACMTGPGPAGAPAGCSGTQFTRSDAESDVDVDMRDFQILQASFTGAD